MAAAGCLISPSQQHPLFRRTAKDLLRLRLVDANPETRRTRELRHLQEQFCNAFMTLRFCHPTYGALAERSIAIAAEEGANKEFEVKSGSGELPLSVWAECIVEWYMPGELKLLHFKSLEVEACEEDDADSVGSSDSINDTECCWVVIAYDPRLPAFTGLRFVNKYFLEAEEFYLTIFIECSYFSLAYYDAKPKPLGDEHGPLREATPDTVDVVRLESINIPSCPSFEASPLEYLKVMESWMVIAHHFQDDAMETARLKSRFEYVYLLVEVGVGRDVSVENANDDGNDDEIEGEGATDQAMDMVAYALVSLVDEAALLDLFNTESTHLQFLEREGSNRRLPLLDDRIVVRISVLDLGENRIVKLSEGFLHAPDADHPERCEVTVPCQFMCFDEKIEFYPSFKTIWGEGAHQYVVTVDLSIFYVPNFDEDENAQEDENVCDHRVLLELWKL